MDVDAISSKYTEWKIGIKVPSYERLWRKSVAVYSQFMGIRTNWRTAGFLWENVSRRESSIYKDHCTKEAQDSKGISVQILYRQMDAYFRLLGSSFIDMKNYA